MIESLEGIVSADGRPVVLELTGRIECTAHLTGMPELSVALNNPTLVQFPAWHPCVRHRPWTEQRQLNFVPPDGSFVLGHYTLAHRGGGSFLSQRSGASYANQLPLTLRVHLGNYEASREGFPFKIAIDPVLRAGLMLEHVTIEWYLGDGARGVDASTSFQGSATYSRSRGFGSAPPDVGTAQPQLRLALSCLIASVTSFVGHYHKWMRPLWACYVVHSLPRRRVDRSMHYKCSSL